MIIIIEQSNGDEYPLNYVRLDIAWRLFLPFSIGDVPNGHGRNLIPLANWFWDVMANRSGNLNADSDKEIHVIVPPLTEEGLDFVVRLCSMWSSEIFFGDKSKNLFTPPVINIFDKPKGSEAKLSRNERGMSERFFTPLLGPSRVFARLEEIQAGGVSARLHSHSAIDEYYLILKGRGHLRFNSNTIEIKAGDLIGKVRGPDNSTQIVADLDESIVVLDMEIWPDSRYNEKDVVSYPDHDEVYLRGQGWSSVLPLKTMFSGNDILDTNVYYGKYKRAMNGTKTGENDER